MPRRTFLLLTLALAAFTTVRAQELPAVTQAITNSIAQHEIAGAVTLVISGDKVVHLAAAGQADAEAARPMSTEAMFWIASMSKPITGAAIMLLQDEGKLSIDDPLAKHLSEFGALKTADGQPAQVTLRHLLTHTSGLAEATTAESLAAKTLAELMPAHLKPLKFVPGSKWQYCQSGINTLGRVIEVVSGQPLPDFLQQRFFTPLGMKDTTFYPTPAQMARLAKPYKAEGNQLSPGEYMPIYAPARPDRFPAANGGLFSTASDYGCFAQMLLHRGTFEGRRYLSEKAVEQYHSVLSGEVVTGFTPGNGWGAACCVVREPQGVSAMLSPGSFGHGGAYGTQAWIDPVKQRAYILMVQRPNFPNSDASTVRRDFQAAAAAALDQRR